MSRKKDKQTRKYKPKNEFRYNNGPVAQGHPQYVFGETRTGKFKSIGLTHSPDDEYKHYPLSHNPNPKDDEDAFLQAKVHTGKKVYYTEPLYDWSFDKSDMPIVRHITKQYKKSTNRKPKRKPPKK